MSAASLLSAPEMSATALAERSVGVLSGAIRRFLASSRFIGGTPLNASTSIERPHGPHFPMKSAPAARDCRVTDAKDRRPSVDHNRADGFAGVHQVKGIVDLLERHGVRDQIIDVDPTIHVPVDDLGHVRTASRAAEGCAFPDAAGD